MHDVARLAGVSRQTVSNVVNAPQRVAGPTRLRVQAAIDQLGYRPYRSARNLKARRSRLLGYRVPSSTAASLNPLLDRFLHALTDAARIDGYHVLLFTPEDSDEEIAAHAELVATGTVDGFVLSETNYGDARAAYLGAAGAAFVTFGRTGLDGVHPWVDVDGAAGMRSAVHHLAGRGHQRIAFVGWPPGSVSGDDRAAGWHAGVVESGADVDATLDLRGPDGLDSGRRALQRLLDQP
nr:LacI family DNA-binding transcriptional regulator [Euzebyales bacterium]